MSGKKAKRSRKTTGRAKKTDFVNAVVDPLESLDIQQYLVHWAESEPVYRFYIEDTKDSVARQYGTFGGGTISQEAAEYTAAVQVTSWREALKSVDPIFCNAEFSSLAVTMTETAPRESVRAEDLIGKEGLLIFEKPITVEPTTGATKVWKNCRAVAWKTMQLGEFPSLVINVWADSYVDDFGRRGLSSVHLNLTGHETTFIRDGELRRDDHTLVRLLRSVTALTRSDISSSVPVSRPAAAGSSFVRSDTPPVVRRVYLRNPEHADYEYDALQAAKSGRSSVRLHWVRGHWRRQWYPASEKHSWKWIEGFIKGDASAGTVPGAKVLIARSLKVA